MGKEWEGTAEKVTVLGAGTRVTFLPTQDGLWWVTEMLQLREDLIVRGEMLA